MASEIANIGPFTGGLSNRSDPASVGDADLVECINYEVEPDGALANRPLITLNPWSANNATGSGVFGTGGGGDIYNQRNGAAVVPVYLAYNPLNGGALLYKMFGGVLRWEIVNRAALNAYTTPEDAGWQTVQGTGSERGTRYARYCMVQYGNRLYYTNNLHGDYKGYMNLGALSANNIPTMPLAETLIAHKERLFAFPGNRTEMPVDFASRFYFTDVLYTTGTWNPTVNFINVGYGDGEGIVGAAMVGGAFVIFKDHSTWRFYYDVNIEEGALEKINSNIGTHNSDSFAFVNGVLYTFFDGALYEIRNYQWRNVSSKVKFQKSKDGSVNLNNGQPTLVSDIAIAALGSRIILSYYGRNYSYNTATGSWSEWETVNPLGRMVTIPSSALDDYDFEAVVGSFYKHTNKPASNSNKQIAQLYRVLDTRDNVPVPGNLGYNNEEFECRFRTKTYDFGGSSAFKRLMWWGIDCITTQDVQAEATVVTNSSDVTYDDLDTQTWDALDRATWDQPMNILPQVQTDIGGEYIALGRRFIKFLKSLRFRQIYFTFKTKVDSAGDSIPSKVFTISAIFRGKSKVSKQVS